MLKWFSYCRIMSTCAIAAADKMVSELMTISEAKATEVDTNASLKVVMVDLVSTANTPKFKTLLKVADETLMITSQRTTQLTQQLSRKIFHRNVHW